MIVTVWCCPTPGCHDYFGSSSAGDLRKEMTYPRVECATEYERIHGRRYVSTRATCPSCRTRGVDVERVPLSVTVQP